MNRFLLSLLLTLVVAAPAWGDVFAITNARVHTVDDLGTLDGATVLVRNGRIEAVGKQVRIPAGARSIDAGGADLTPDCSSASRRWACRKSARWPRRTISVWRITIAAQPSPFVAP